MKNILFFILLCCGPSVMPCGRLYAHIEKINFLKGKVGDRDLAIKMLVYDELPERYITFFFQDNKKEKHLIGKVQGNLWVFTGDEENEKGESDEQIVLKLVEGTGSNWKGVWSDSTGKSWDINLTAIVPDSIPSKFDYLQFIQELDPFERYRLSDITFIKTRSEKIKNGLVVDWYLEKGSGINFFRLRSPKNKINTDKINAAVESLNLSILRGYYSFNPNNINTQIETSILCLTDELISFAVLSKNIRKQSKTVQGRQIFNLDIKKGTMVHLEDLLLFDPQAKVNSEDIDQVYNYRKEIFAPKLFNILNELYPEKMRSDSCDLNKVETWVLPAWTLTKKGISFGFFTVDECNALDWATVPYERLNPFMLTKYHLKAKN